MQLRAFEVAPDSEPKTESDGAIRWRLPNGQRHREDGPAIEYSDGAKSWYQNDVLHREDGPAVELPDGSKFWYQNDVHHREDGPAVEYSDGPKEWWINGRQLTEEQFNRRTHQASLQLLAFEVDFPEYVRGDIVKFRAVQGRPEQIAVICDSPDALHMVTAAWYGRVWSYSVFDIVEKLGHTTDIGGLARV